MKSHSQNKNIIKYVTIAIAVIVAYFIYKNFIFFKSVLMEYGIYEDKQIKETLDMLNTFGTQQAIKETKKFVISQDSSGNLKMPDLNLTGLSGLGLFKIPDWSGINGGGGVLS